HQLLLRGAYIQPLASGIYSFLPLGQRVKRRVERILREEMDWVGGQEVTLPVLQPAEPWRQTGRWDAIGPELVRVEDRSGHDMVLAMTHEEAFTDLLQSVKSYRHLPVMLYQIQTKIRDEARPRGGLIRMREFTMKDAYSAHVSMEDLDRFYPRMYEAYLRIFRRCGLDAVPVEADSGMMGGSTTHEFMYLSPIGEDVLALCGACAYTANREVATFGKPVPEVEEMLPLEETATPDTETIAALTELLGVPASRTAKAVFFGADSRLVFAVVRGDMEINETKLANALGVAELRPARADELAGTGIVPGYASPIGISGAVIVVDDLVARSANLIAGANRIGYHLLNTNAGRDYQPDLTADIAAVYDGAPCPRCGSPLRLTRAVEIGHTFKLGTKYSAALGARYLDWDGKLCDIVMASYGIGVDRLIACVAEACHDERGLIWPVALAPFAVYLVGLDLDDAAVHKAAEDLYAALRARGVEVLYDDRDERAGVKFKDADLLGIPLRVTVSRRTLRDAAFEVKRRNLAETRHIPAGDIADEIARMATTP
ncbi:MAG: proline--tRNA ligase, partial [Chloroflexota bacterium]